MDKKFDDGTYKENEELLKSYIGVTNSLIKLIKATDMKEREVFNAKVRAIARDAAYVYLDMVSMLYETLMQFCECSATKETSLKELKRTFDETHKSLIDLIQ